MEIINIDIIQNGLKTEYVLKIGMYGYCYKFYTSIEDVEVIYEKDDEGNIRSIVPVQEFYSKSFSNTVLAIGEELSKHF